MLINPEIIPKTFRCKQVIGEYLIYKLGLPVLSIKNNFYYFIDNDELREIIKGLPLWLKIMLFFEK
jgi:hypothetical protein